MVPELPPSLPINAVAQTWRFMTRPFPLFDECAARIGEIFTVRLVGQGNWVLLSNPEHLKALYTAPADVLHAGEANHRLFSALLGSNSLVSLDGEAHLKRRRLLMPPLHGDRMRFYGPILQQLTQQNVASWPHDRPFSLLPQLQRIVMQSIQRAIFGIGHVQETASLARLLLQLAEVGAESPLLLIPPLQIDLGRWSPWGRIAHLIRATDDAIQAEIDRRRNGVVREDADVLSLLLTARDEAGRPFSDRELRDELVTMLLAGYMTTSSSLSWVVERLLRSPDKLQQMMAEIDRVCGEDPLTTEHLTQLDYLDAVIKEAMRVRPTVSVSSTRLLKQRFEIGGYRLPEGTVLGNCIYLTHRRPEIGPSPEAFIPERFLQRKESPYEWTPFGGGVRRCIGMAFALYEMKVVLATMFREVELAPLEQDAPCSRRGWFVVPKQGLIVRVTSARSSLGARGRPAEPRPAEQAF